MKPRLIVSRQIAPDVVTRIHQDYDCPYEGKEMSASEVIAALHAHKADALLITSHVRYGAAEIAAIPDHVKILATYSVGTDHIDIAACKARGLQASNTPNVLTECTADLALLLMLNAFRRGAEYEAIMRKGWRVGYGMGEMMGRRMSGKTLGILGMGRIGRAVAARARGFGMRILYHNARRLPAELEAGAEYVADFRAMLPQIDVLSLHAPAGPSTTGIMNAETFALMKPGAVFINTARGALVDEDALLDALQSNHLFAAGLDVFKSEPEFDLRFAALPNVFLTPHMASATVETRNAMGYRALDNIAAVLAGRPPLDPLWT